jgi:hypothetical protein
MSTRSASAQRVHNTRHRDKRRASDVLQKPTKKETRKPEKTEEKTLDEGGWYVVKPAIWVDNMQPVLTDDLAHAEEVIRGFKHAEDYSFLKDVDKQMAMHFLEECEAERVNRDKKQMYSVVLPSKESGMKPFVTANPRTIREFVEDIDSKARFLSAYTLAKAEDVLNKYVSTNLKETTNYNILKPEVETILIDSDDEVEVVAGPEQIESTKAKSVSTPACGISDTEQLAKDATDALEYLRHQQDELCWWAVMPSFDGPDDAFVTTNISEAHLYKVNNHGTNIDRGLTKQQALAIVEKYNQDKQKHISILNGEYGGINGTIAKSGRVCADMDKIGLPEPINLYVGSQKPVNPYITPEKANNGVDSPSLLSPPEPPKAAKSVTFTQDGNFHGSFMTLERAESMESSGLSGLSAKVKAKPAPVSGSMDKVSPTKRLSYEEVVAKRQAKAQQQLDRTGYDLKVAYFAPVGGYQDFVVVSVELVRSSDGKTAHWLMKWFLAAKVLADIQPKFTTSRTWFKTCTSALIRNTPFGPNSERTNSKNYPENQLFGLVSRAELEENEPLDQVCKNLAEDIKAAMKGKTFQSKYLTKLNDHYPKVHSSMEQQAKRNDNKKGVWEDIATSTVKTQGLRSLDAVFLDGDIKEIATILFDPEDYKNRWPDEIRFACYRNGELPWEIW